MIPFLWALVLSIVYIDQRCFKLVDVIRECPDVIKTNSWVAYALAPRKVAGVCAPSSTRLRRCSWHHRPGELTGVGGGNLWATCTESVALHLGQACFLVSFYPLLSPHDSDKLKQMQVRDSYHVHQSLIRLIFGFGDLSGKFSSATIYLCGRLLTSLKNNVVLIYKAVNCWSATVMIVFDFTRTSFNFCGAPRNRLTLS